jgi:hypothetical protein
MPLAVSSHGRRRAPFHFFRVVLITRALSWLTSHTAAVNTISLGVKFQHRNFGRYQHSDHSRLLETQSITWRSCLKDIDGGKKHSVPTLAWVVLKVPIGCMPGSELSLGDAKLALHRGITKLVLIFFSLFLWDNFFKCYAKVRGFHSKHFQECLFKTSLVYFMT